MRRAAILLSLVLVTSACMLRSRVKGVFEGAAAADQRAVCVLMFDGLSKDALDKALAAKLLPNLEGVITSRGLSYDNAIASAPTETYPNISALLTGLLPGHHGIPANIWLDRRGGRFREAHTNIFRPFSASDFLVPEARTLFEYLPGEGIAITSPIARGASVHARNVLTITASYMRNDWAFLDRTTLDDMGDAYEGAAKAGHVPRIVWGHILGPDEVAHYDGPDSAEFRACLSAIDRSFGRLVKRLTKLGLTNRLLFVLVADHGNAPFSTTVDATALVQATLDQYPAMANCDDESCRPVALPKTKRLRKDRDTAGAEIEVGAYRGVMIWLPSDRPLSDVPRAFRTRKRPPAKTTRKPRQLPPRLEFADALARRPEIQIVAARGAQEGTVVLYAAKGTSEIVREDGDRASTYLYRVIEGKDPLGYDPSLRDHPLPGAAWLRATATAEFPDLVVQVVELFDSPRAPDVYLLPSPGFGFRDGRAAGHGSLSRLEMVVPLVFAGPGVSPGRRFVCRTVDLAPTLLRYLGVEFDPASMDGDDLAITAGPGIPTLP
ncbi:MAG: alkaline phosphatase family protein [Acidobacteria bacterium]|nr:alkaline phosphatase family protein [Acidobacteriota bacterium]